MNGLQFLILPAFHKGWNVLLCGQCMRQFRYKKDAISYAKRVRKEAYAMFSELAARSATKTNTKSDQVAIDFLVLLDELATRNDA